MSSHRGKDSKNDSETTEWVYAVSGFLNALLKGLKLAPLQWEPYYEKYDPITQISHGEIKEIATQIFQTTDALRPYALALTSVLGSDGMISNHVKKGIGYRIWISASFIGGFIDQRTSYLEKLECKEGSLDDKAIGSLMGLAVGDALGLTHEKFPSGDLVETKADVMKQRKDLKDKPIEILGGGPFALPPGEFTDDTSMALCLADSLIIKNKTDLTDQIERYIKWWFHGWNASVRVYNPDKDEWHGKPHGLGGNIKKALYRFCADANRNPVAGGKDPTKDAGNGACMRMCPVALFWHNDLKATMKAAKLQAAVTHNVDEAMDACALMSFIIHYGLNGKSKKEIFDMLPTLTNDLKSAEIAELTTKDAKWKTKGESDLITLPGRTLWSLEAALHCLYNTNDFETAMIRVVRLGGDADTTGAILGQMAGAIYGATSIPERWLIKLKYGKQIVGKALALVHKTPLSADIQV